MLETKEYASELWENLSRGLDALYEKYQSLTSQSDTTYQKQIDALAPAYQKLKTRAGVQSKIARANLDQRFAQSGLAVSGESNQRQLLQSAALQNALTDLELQEQGARNDLESKRLDSRVKLDAEAHESAAKYIAEMTELYQKQLQQDRNHALEAEKLRIQEEHNKAEEELKLKQYELQKQQLQFQQSVKSAYSSASSSKKTASAAPTSKSESSILGVGGSKLIGSGSGGYSPKSVTPKQFVEALVKSSDTRSRFQAQLQAVLQNPDYDVQYRREILLYSRLNGYL